jgi:aminoglycoside phosphotransferase (APT) family kinase protein
MPGTARYGPNGEQDDPLLLARLLADIHSIDRNAHDLAFLPAPDLTPAPNLTRRSDEAFAESTIRTALAQHSTPLSLNAAALLHGDFWPGNVLWQGARGAVIDWEDAALGDPLFDLANSRREVLWFYGAAGLERFTRAYQAHMPHLDYAALPWYDLLLALRAVGKVHTWGLDGDTVAEFAAQQRAFVRAAAAQLTAR